MDQAEDPRERVLRLAREIEHLSTLTVPPDQFFAEFLKRTVEAVAAPAGVVWLQEGGALRVAAEVRLAETGLGQSPQAQQNNQRILLNTLQTGESGKFVPGAEGEHAAPTQHLVIVAAVHLDKNVVGVVELFQRPDSPSDAHSGYLQFLEHMCGHASRFLSRRQAQPAQQGSADPFWTQLEDVSLQLQRSLETEEVCTVAANDGKQLLECDRLSIAIRRGRSTSIRAISGQDMVNARANLVRCMVALAENVIRMGETLQYTGRIENLAPQIEVPLANYIHESGSRFVQVIPLFETPPLVSRHEDEEDGATTPAPRGAFGCLIIEQIADSDPRQRVARYAEMYAEHVAAALFNSIRHQRIPFLRTLNRIGRTLEWFHGRKLAKTLVALSLVTGILSAMAFVPWDYRVNGEGQLMPVVQKEVFAPWDGEVIDLKVFGGESVQAGDTLMVLRNKELQSEMVATLSQKNETLELLQTLKAQIDEDRNDRTAEELTDLLGQLEKARVELIGIESQLTILEERLQALTIRAPIAGVVATFQVEQRLRNRPIRRGEVLVEIMDDSQQWHLELHLEEHRMGHILRSLPVSRDDAEEPAEIAVEYRLATDPETTYNGRLNRTGISTRAMQSEELGNVVLAFAEIEPGQPPGRRIGAEVQAKLYCGKRSLGYVLFGDVVEFLQKFFWL